MEMDYNSLILGRIPCVGNGICKTYQESIIRYFYDYDLKAGEPVYLSATNGIYFGERASEEDKDMEVLRIYAYGESARHFLVEFIDKDILRAHLQDERDIIERLIESGQNTLTLK